MAWASYGLSDFLMFSPAVYWRLVADYNAALWPMQLPALAGGLALLWLTARAAPGHRAACLLLAAAWAATGWGFHWNRYADIFLAAPWLAMGCWMQAALLAGAAWLRHREAQPPGLRVWGGVAAVGAALLFPLLSLPHWQRAEVVGLMPDPTALATLGWLLATRTLPRWARVGLAVLPFVSLLLGVATRVALAQ